MPFICVRWERFRSGGRFRTEKKRGFFELGEEVEHEPDGGQAVNFPSRSCFRHKYTKAVILSALKGLRQLHAEASLM